MTKKAKILKSAAKLFAEKGFNDTSTCEVAEAAGVAHGTVFYHFKSKEGLLSAMYESLIDEYMTGLKSVSAFAENGLKGVESMLFFHSVFADKYRSEFTVMHRDMPSFLCEKTCGWYKKMTDNSKKSISIIADAIRRGQADGSISNELEPETSALTLKALLTGMTRMKYLSMVDTAYDFKGAAEFCLSALRNREE
ncbi:TetR/AcrR family transcriptional regulator [Geovibrio thiophilus]|uniref:TetR/AcrR family transcriptional regulator n=1 Tax=Geovibrio thiophilus TaxID=139438 RepID=UPI0013E2A351|nr:TetR/AcrR family transcriptional regulator [Geovibrio thiophilus]